jgi:O-antigen ligase
MNLWLRAAVVLAILAYGPNLLEQFEPPKAAVVRVIGVGLLAAVVASLLAGTARGGPSPARRAVPAGDPRGRTRPEAGRRAQDPAPGGEPAFRWRALDLCVGAWLLVELASTLASVSPTISLLGDTAQHEGLLTSLGLAGLYGAARLATTDAASARRTLAVILGAVAASCAVAYWQLATFDRARWENAPAFGEWFRPFGSLGHANLLGAMGAGALAAAVGLAASRAQSRAWWLAGALLFGATTALTLSRAAWVAAVVGSLAALILGGAVRANAPRRRMRLAVVALGLGAAALGLVLLARIGPLRARALELLALGSGSGRSRLEIWRTALAMWSAHPWLGSGPDTFRLLFDRHQTAGYWSWEWGSNAFHAHSVYLHTLATRGIAGVLAAAAVVGAAALALRDASRREAAGRPLVPALAGLLVALGVAGGTGAVGVAGAAVVAWTLGSLPGLSSQQPAPRKPTARARSRVPLVAGGLAGLLALVPTGLQLWASHEAFESGLQEKSWSAIAAAQRAEQLAPWSDVMAANAADLLRKSAARAPDPDATLALAERSARRAVRAAPQRVYDWSELALVLLLRSGGGAVGADREAAASIARCIELGPYNTFPLISFTEQAIHIHRGDLALPVARRAAEVYPGDAESRALLGEAYRALGDTVAARSALEQSLALDWRGNLERRDRVRQVLAELQAGPGKFVFTVP